MKLPWGQIKKVDWDKRWSELVTLWIASYLGEQYYYDCRKYFKAGFNNVFVVWREGTITCYQSKKENDKFGKVIAGKILQDNKYVNKLCNGAEKNGELLLRMIKKPASYLMNLENYLAFEKQFNKYLPEFMAVNRVVNYLPAEILGLVFPSLKKARIATEHIYKEIDDFFRKLVKLISKKSKVKQELLLHLYYDEFKKYLSSGELPSQKILSQRKSPSGLYFRDGNRYFMNSHDVVKLEKIITSAALNKIGKDIKGQPASNGKVVGIARIILNPHKVSKFDKGDIIITGMTNPDFVPLMKKSGAIVTDAGGILSHAAIVSRELKKPCIIGTKIATKVLKDGDMVEVDANNGTVKKL